ncbi:hypothetical protein BCR36DRAFT_374501 [Piromyces finnis]|uniref:Uncharacterized protein n=1 Tax=Piromyces finnis TaxID=1754191 RepID=A0A1Y1UWG3_9FUNG|nr:hypothetical protein BCR36DRAFT_374501 [Piromyces finnis]|eukprot:ORX42484.1 hypothetical protein BCR36DRAFT_374501 [Piromyces finnis]
MNENDLNVVASFTKCVEDLRSGSKRNHRIRRIRHRAQKRSRKNRITQQTVEPTIEKIVEKPIEKEVVLPVKKEISEVEIIVAPTLKSSINNNDNFEKVTVPKVKNINTIKKKETSKVRNSLPLVDLCRDRRRRISSIKKNSSENISRNDIAYALKPNYSVKKTAKQSFMPTWAKFSLSWNNESSILDSLRNVKINSPLNNLPLITLAA